MSVKTPIKKNMESHIALFNKNKNKNIIFVITLHN